MNIIEAISNSGYSQEEALNILTRTYPGLYDAITSATKAGFGPARILSAIGTVGLGALSKFKGRKGERNPDPYPEANPYIEAKNEQERHKKPPQALKTAAKVGGGLALTAAAPYLASAASSLASPYLASAGTTALKAGAGVAAGMGAKNLISNAGKEESSQVDPKNVLDQLGFTDQIKNMATKLSPDDIASVMEQHLLKPFQKQWLKQNVPESLSSLIGRFISSGEGANSADTGMQEPTASPIEEREGLLQPTEAFQQDTIPQQPIANKGVEESAIGNTTPIEPEKQEDLKKELQPQDAVLTKKGRVGRVKKVKKGIAEIEVDGKTEHRSVDDLEKSPLPERELADIYEELVQAIPEKARSSVINFAGYDANANELAFRPHNGAMYIYKDIPEEFAEKLKNSMFKAKTTGENFYGSWAQGEESRFAGLSQLIRDLQKQYGGRGKEYVRKYETLYDFLGVPEAAKKDREKQRKKAKKALK